MVLSPSGRSFVPDGLCVALIGGPRTVSGFLHTSFPATMYAATPAGAGRPHQIDGTRFFSRVADTKKIEDTQERKKVKRAARKKAAPKAKRTTPRGANKKKVKKLVRGQSKR